MSYLIEIWVPEPGPLPASLEEVVSTLEALHDAAPRSSDKFVALAKALMSEYPRETSADGEAVPRDEWAWSDGPLHGLADCGVYGIGLNTARLQEVRPFVIAEATARGLAVFDMQAGEAYLPGGIVLPPCHEPASPPATQAGAPRGTELMNAVFAFLEPLLRPHGFKANRKARTFRRTFPGGWQLIVFPLEDRSPRFSEFALNVRVRVDPVSELYVSLIAPGSTHPEEYESAFLLQKQWLRDAAPFIRPETHNYVVTSPEDLPRVLDHLASQWSSVLLPLLQACRSLEGFNAQLNTQPPEKSVFSGLFQPGALHPGRASGARPASARDLRLGLVEAPAPPAPLTGAAVLRARAGAPVVRACAAGRAWLLWCRPRIHILPVNPGHILPLRS